MIAKLGQRTGFNTTPLLTIFDHDTVRDDHLPGDSAASALEMALLHSAVNNCKTRIDQLRFTVMIESVSNAM